jgi:ribosomal protein S18 acetylase RimI-like enzyme
VTDQFRLLRLDPATPLKPFDCDDAELNDFLFEDAANYARQLLAVTYVLETGQEIVGYFSVLNDSIRHNDTTKSGLRRALKLLPHSKRGYKSHPAVKVGRLAVNRKYQSQGIGTKLMDYIKGYFLDNNKTGCRFITVDANNKERTINFYRKNGFDFLTSKDAKEPNRLMYCDLILYTDHPNGS